MIPMVIFGPLVPGGSPWHLLPFGLGQFPVNLHALRPEDLSVSRHSAVEDIEVAVQLPLKQAPGQFHWIGPGLLARLVMDVLQPIPQHYLNITKHYARRVDEWYFDPRLSRR
jgi:hypothetical protein